MYEIYMLGQSHNLIYDLVDAKVIPEDKAKSMSSATLGASVNFLQVVSAKRATKAYFGVLAVAI